MPGLRPTLLILGWALASFAVNVPRLGSGRCGDGSGRQGGAVAPDAEASCRAGGLSPGGGGEDGAATAERMAVSALQSSLAVQPRGGPAGAPDQGSAAEGGRAGGGGGRSQPASGPAASDPSIPGVIFMAGPWLPGGVVAESLPFVPAGTEVRFYGYGQVDRSAARISAELEALGVPGVHGAMRQLRPWSFRMDLWRYLILWENGGYYLDAKIVLRQNLSSWVGASNGGSFVACKAKFNQVDESIDRVRENDGSIQAGAPPSYQSCALAARPRDPLLLNAIRRIVSNVQSRWYGPPPSYGPPWLFITGPGLLESVIEEGRVQPHAHCQFIEEQSIDGGEPVDGRIIQTDQNTTLMVLSSKVHEEMRTCSTCNSYEDLYDIRAVYCDEYVPPGHGDDPCVADYFENMSHDEEWLSFTK
ncbi:unnamed protein product [Prorocentrum cordatum]|uniref:Alpha-1,6-mannosyl-glycoprotein 6-beta-N-acetylglucosaminyltransferase n=1 Tax=Prorocentrum cordatum TaxID=2364126 RepID=A0ABN9RB81_9DINO|nr:unnamed protein product [Polarella glacialis]